jgi:hypothetical protein
MDIINLLDSDFALFARFGISGQLLALAGIERVTDQTAREKYGISGSGDMSGVVFPYFDPQTGRRTTARVRRDNPEIEDRQPKRKYVSAYGDRQHLYFPPASKELLADPSVPIILVEAEKSVLAMTAFAERVGRKYLAVGLGGCWGWRGRIGKIENSHGERVDQMGPLPDLACVSKGRSVIILLDTNRNSNPKVQQAERALRFQLIKQAANVSVAELPAKEGVNGPDDYIGIAGDDAMAAVLDTSTKSDGNFSNSIDHRTERKRRAQELLLELGSDIEFFHTSDRDSFASINVDGHIETFSIKSSEFSHLLRHRYYLRTSGAPPKQALEDVINIFGSRSLFEGTEQTVFRRVADDNGTIYLDLADADWSSVKIYAKGWEILPNPPIKFIRSRGMRPLLSPIGGGDVDRLRSFLNIADQEWPLVLTWILAAYRRQGPFPVLILNGEQGSCKSSASAVLRCLVDPNAANLRSSPRDERDLFISASNSWVITLDNLSHLPDWLSDALCRLATGGGLSTRQLYSDLNETIIDVQRPIILNGIGELATRGDLLDRSIVVTLPTLTADKRRDEAEFKSAFQSAMPKILGAMLDALSGALTKLPLVKLSCKPRMADFALFGVAVERALGWRGGTFINAYEANRSIANSSVLEASPIALAIQALVAKGGVFEGTATDLLNELGEYADAHARNHRYWPDSGWKLSHMLRRLAPSLRASGLDATFGDRQPDHKRARIIRIRAAASSASDVSDIVEELRMTRTHSDAQTNCSDAESGMRPIFTGSHAVIADAPDTSDASAQSSMVRGEI